MFFLILTFLVCSASEQISITVEESNIKKFLFSNYDSSIRPDQKVNLNMKLNLKQLVSLNIPNQIVSTSSELFISWIDSRLEWSPSNYSNISKINCQASLLWLPTDLFVKNTADSNGFISFANYKVSLFNTGLIFINVFLNGISISYFIIY